MKPPTLKERVRIAHTLRDQLRQLAEMRQRAIEYQLAQLVAATGRLADGRRRLFLSTLRSWPAAAERTVRQIQSALRDIPFQVSQTERAIQDAKVAVPSVRDIVADLDQIEEEFGGLSYQPTSQELAVQTEAIELEQVYLGPFQICLALGRVGDGEAERMYRIVALDPQPPSSNDSVTHPHVSDEHLCAGEAVVPIRQALTGGRLADFFTIVRSVLTTYNPDSPYVSLDNWYGRPCFDCGDHVDDDEIRWCSSCERDYCDQCLAYCSLCDDTTCLSCLVECTVCGDAVCAGCRTTCEECGETLCRTCHDERACPCLEEQGDESNEQDQGTDETGQPVATEAA